MPQGIGRYAAPPNAAMSVVESFGSTAAMPCWAKHLISISGFISTFSSWICWCWQEHAQLPALRGLILNLWFLLKYVRMKCRYDAGIYHFSSATEKGSWNHSILISLFLKASSMTKSRIDEDLCSCRSREQRSIYTGQSSGSRLRRPV